MEVTKIAIATDDGKTITSHFGRAKSYKVVTIADSKVVAEELRDKAPCGGHGHHANPSGEDSPRLSQTQEVAVIQDGAVTTADSNVGAEELQTKASCGEHHHHHQHEGEGHHHHEGEGHHHHHQHEGEGEGHHNHHIAAIRDCQVLLARGMGTGAQTNLVSAGIQPLLTSVRNIDEAVTSYLAGTLQHHPERIH